jgi:competence protein ComEA
LPVLAVVDWLHDNKKEECMIRTPLSLFALAVLLSSPVAFAASQDARTSAKAPSAPPMVNINTAPAAELQTLPGVGPATAARIVEYRQKNGPFKKLEELMNVRGMGEKTFLKLRPQLTITAPITDAGRQN